MMGNDRFDLLLSTNLGFTIASSISAFTFSILGASLWVIIPLIALTLAGMTATIMRIISNQRREFAKGRKVVRWRRTRGKRQRLPSYGEDIRTVKVKPLLNTAYSYHDSKPPPEDMDEEFSNVGDRNSDIFG